jgi:hypothetical protein
MGGEIGRMQTFELPREGFVQDLDCFIKVVQVCIELSVLCSRLWRLFWRQVPGHKFVDTVDFMIGDMCGHPSELITRI